MVGITPASSATRKRRKRRTPKSTPSQVESAGAVEQKDGAEPSNTAAGLDYDKFRADI